MSRLSNVFSVYLMIGLIVFGFGGATMAQTIQKTRSERSVRDALRSLNSKVDDFKYSLDNELGRNDVSAVDEREINDSLQAFEKSLDAFSDKLNRRRENAGDVRNVLTAAQTVNDFLNAKRFGAMTRKDWTEIRNLLNRLASNYQVSWNWDGGNQNYPTNSTSGGNYPTNSNSYNKGLMGTYRLDAARSEDAKDIAERAIRDGNTQNNSSNPSNPNVQSDLESKLTAPERVMIEVRGNQITLASSNAAQLTFTADGRDRTENNSDGRTIRVRSTLRGQELTVSSLGGETDYTVVFTSIDNGKAMRVTRRVTTDYLRQTVFAESIYGKTDQTAQFENNPNYNDDETYSSSDSQDNRTINSGNYPTVKNGRTGDYIVPNGTIVSGILEKDIDTKVSQNNDRFEMVVQSPNEYRGAMVEGYISGVNRSGKVSGRSQITFNFERIRLSNGRVCDFNGFLQGVTDENGKVVKVDTEGTAKGDDQTTETVKRGGIGAGIGAIIGAIAGGGKGAAIGAILGGGAGAGSVIVQGKDDLQLKAGSTITVQTSSPVR